jgi:hypothetical protein
MSRVLGFMRVSVPLTLDDSDFFPPYTEGGEKHE